MKFLLTKLLLVCVLTASLPPKYASATTEIKPAVAVACVEDDLPCLRLTLLNKQDEVISLGKRIGLREQQIQLLQQTVDMGREQLAIALSSNKTLLDAANKLVPHWYESPWLWFGIGVFIGGGLVVLTAFAVSQALK